MTFSEIRSQFLNYYAELGFQLLPSAPMLHPSIPMSFVMSAGLVQVETSLAKAHDRLGNRFTLVQNCFRHFDLKTVGNDDLHLSLFEMPGAFAFESDGKQQTIQHMWQLATERLGIDANRLWASYFSGGKLFEYGLSGDGVARQTWLELGLSAKRIVGLGVEHNYWRQRDGIRNSNESLRKCGPNTELFYDRGLEFSCSKNCRPGCKCGRFVEFANSLFITHGYDPINKRLTALPQPFNETVIGTERVTMILQKLGSVFDIEIYRPALNFIRSFVARKTLPLHIEIASERVLADYARALYILVADGAPPPGRNGRERIIKLLIRGIITRQTILGVTSDNFLPKLMREIISVGHLKDLINEETIALIVLYYSLEQERFQSTITKGLHRLEACLSPKGAKLSGADILYLEKKWGLPLPIIDWALYQKGFVFPYHDYKNAVTKWKLSVQTVQEFEE